MFAFLWWLGAGYRGVGAARAAAVSCLLLCLPLAAAAEEADDPAPVQSQDVVREIWSGAETYGATWAFYSGLTYAPDGFAQPGFRFRLSAGMSTYSYSSALGRARAAQPFADLLAGYQAQIGSVTLKAFVGGTGSADIRTIEQARDLWGQSRVGVKAAVEGWWAIDNQQWAALDLSFASPQTFVWSRMRYGLRVHPQVSLGPEAGLSGNVARLGGRLGGFARVEWETGEVALSGGVAAAPSVSTGEAAADAGYARAPYMTLLYLQRF